MNLGQLLKKITDKLTAFGQTDLVKDVVYSDAINYTARTEYKSLPIVKPTGYMFANLLTNSSQIASAAGTGFKAEPIYWDNNQIYIKITTLSNFVVANRTVDYHAIFIKEKLGGVTKWLLSSIGLRRCYA